MNEKLSQEQIATLRTETAIIDAKVRAARSVAITLNKCDVDVVADMMRALPGGIKGLGKSIKLMSVITDVYAALNLAHKLEAQGKANNSILRGYGYFLRGELDHPFVAEFVKMATEWDTTNLVWPIVKSVLEFEKFTLTEFLHAMRKIDSSWSFDRIDQQTLLGYTGLLGKTS